MKSLIFIFLIISATILLCCNNNPVSSQYSQYPIWYTDEQGNYLGGDSNNFCVKAGSNCLNIPPVYPNPVNKYFNIKINSFAVQNYRDTASLFFIKNSDTIFIFKKSVFKLGSYYYRLNKDSLGFSNETIRLELKREQSGGIIPYCNEIINYSKCFMSGNVRFN